MKPILFNTEMVKALLDGRKTVTRRIVKPQPSKKASWLDKCAGVYTFSDATFPHEPYSSGDILYVRETFGWLSEENKYVYKASDFECVAIDGFKWSPSLHMPKEAARIFLRVTDVRVERLQEITEEQAVKEGCVGLGVFDSTAWNAFIDLWNSTLKKDSDCTWMHNPWVWVIEFERCEKP